VLCPDCQYENPAGSKFCLRCGTRLGQSCVHCKAHLPTDARFCNECGYVVSSVPVSSEPVAALERGGCIDLARLVKDFENQLIDTALHVTGGSRRRAAELLGINRTTLIAKLRRGQDQD
jgi:DNA-binding NtrC family response regulator